MPPVVMNQFYLFIIFVFVLFICCCCFFSVFFFLVMNQLFIYEFISPHTSYKNYQKERETKEKKARKPFRNGSC